MVSNTAPKFEFKNFHSNEVTEAEAPVKWCSVSLNEIILHNKRLEASAFSVEAKAAIMVIKKCKHGYIGLLDKHSLVTAAYHAPRFKRNYVENPNDASIGFLGSSEMLNIKPAASKYITNKMAEALNLRVKENTVLLSCSGTIGKLTYVNRTLKQYAFSQHIIRLECSNYSGYIYACLSSYFLQTQIKSLVYGAVIPEIEPEHLKSLIIPDATDEIKKKIHCLIHKSFELRDESNELINKATQMMVAELNLSPIHKFKIKYFDNASLVDTFSIKLSAVNGRLDCSYHAPLVEAIVKHLKNHADEVTTVGDTRISKEIVLAGVFKRIYVDKEYGIPFLGGKEITQLNPAVEKFLSKTHHNVRYKKELQVKENTILVTDRGTIGTTALVPKHFEGWAVSQNVLKLVPANDDIAGYVYIFLNSEWGNVLICRQTYGSVVDMIDNNSLSNVEIPLLKNKIIQRQINDMALEANKKRYEAYELEQEALRIMDEEVIH
ncbi:MAG: restriction endonuclease subunit S [Acidaminococcaceae bacterium]